MSCSVAERTDRHIRERLEKWIEQRTGGRVHYLQVETNGERVMVRGCTGSYYVRQLALAAVLEVIAPDQLEQVDLDIQVGTLPAARRIGFGNSSDGSTATFSHDRLLAVGT